MTWSFGFGEAMSFEVKREFRELTQHFNSYFSNVPLIPQRSRNEIGRSDTAQLLKVHV